MEAINESRVINGRLYWANLCWGDSAVCPVSSLTSESGQLKRQRVVRPSLAVARRSITVAHRAERYRWIAVQALGSTGLARPSPSHENTLHVRRQTIPASLPCPSSTLSISPLGTLSSQTTSSTGLFTTAYISDKPNIYLLQVVGGNVSPAFICVFVCVWTTPLKKVYGRTFMESWNSGRLFTRKESSQDNFIVGAELANSHNSWLINYLGKLALVVAHSSGGMRST